jgi:hypothetical protein
METEDKELMKRLENSTQALALAIAARKHDFRNRRAPVEPDWRLPQVDYCLICMKVLDFEDAAWSYVLNCSIHLDCLIDSGETGG